MEVSEYSGRPLAQVQLPGYSPTLLEATSLLEELDNRKFTSSALTAQAGSSRTAASNPAVLTSLSPWPWQEIARSTQLETCS
jgi:hypothetical protein